MTEPAPPPPPLPPNPPPPPPPTARVLIELTWVGNTNEDEPLVNRTMQVPSTVIESSNEKFEVLVPSIEHPPLVTITAEATGVEKGVRVESVDIARIVIRLREIRRRREAVVTDIGLPLLKTLGVESNSLITHLIPGKDHE
jgi:hypothetical protein